MKILRFSFITLCLTIFITIPIYATTSVSMCVAGDNLIHSTVYKRAYHPRLMKYDFTECYTEIRDYIKSFDLSVINQETIFVDDDSKISSYPTFGTPTTMGDALVHTGFDVILGANNHVLDKGSDMAEFTRDWWETNYPHIPFLGINTVSSDYMRPVIVSKNGITMAMYNATYGANGFHPPKNKSWLINSLFDIDRLTSKIQEYKDQVDVSICFLHTGTEYTYSPDAYTVDKVSQCIDAGADIVICSHPHVVQAYGRYVTDARNTGFVYWSLGNFLSGQVYIDRKIGGLATFTLVKTSNGVSIKDVRMIPIVHHTTANATKVYLLEDYNDILAATSNEFTKYKNWNQSYLLKVFDDILAGGKHLDNSALIWKG